MKHRILTCIVVFTVIFSSPTNAQQPSIKVFSSQHNLLALEKSFLDGLLLKELNTTSDEKLLKSCLVKVLSKKSYLTERINIAYKEMTDFDLTRISELSNFLSSKKGKVFLKYYLNRENVSSDEKPILDSRDNENINLFLNKVVHANMEEKTFMFLKNGQGLCANLRIKNIAQ